jgi:hypothetical protein
MHETGILAKSTPGGDMVILVDGKFSHGYISRCPGRAKVRIFYPSAEHATEKQATIRTVFST